MHRSIQNFESDRLERRTMLAAATNVFDLSATLAETSRVVVGDAAIFIHNNDLYRSYGTAGTTQVVYDGSSTIKDLTVAPNGNVYFVTSNKLYRLNTSTSGAVLVADLDANSSTGSNPRGLREFVSGIAVADDILYIFADLISSPGGVVSLYFSEGVPNDASFVADDLPSFNVGNSRTNLGQTLVYAAADDTLWRSDGSPAGTFQLADGLDEGDGFNILSANGFVYFSADDNQGSPTDHGIWSSDGTLGGTNLLDPATEIDLVEGVVGDNGQVYFPIANGLYTSDGSIANSGIAPGTSIITSMPAFLAAVGNNIYFSATTNLAAYQAINRLNLTSNTITKVTDNTSGYSIGIDAGNTGAAALTSYIFTGEVTSFTQRFYITNPITDEIDVVTSVPDGVANARLGKPFAIAGGAFFTGGTNDLYFVDVPFSILNPTSTILYAEATTFTDLFEVETQSGEIVLSLYGKEERHQLSAVGRMEVQLGAGNDTYIASTDFPINTYIFGDTGDDTMLSGSGEDTLTGGAGRNRLFGGFGNDKINGSNGRDFLRGEDGDDRLYGRAGNDDLAGGGGIDRLFGDELIGGQGADFLKGGSSNDKLYGRGGNDTLVGERHDDLIFGGEGDDRLVGSEGNDTLDGQEGNDSLYGESGSDTLIGNLGNDSLFAVDLTADALDGGDGTDTADHDDGLDSVLNSESFI